PLAPDEVKHAAAFFCFVVKVNALLDVDREGPFAAIAQLSLTGEILIRFAEKSVGHLWHEIGEGRHARPSLVVGANFRLGLPSPSLTLSNLSNSQRQFCKSCACR